MEIKNENGSGSGTENDSGSNSGKHISTVGNENEK